MKNYELGNMKTFAVINSELCFHKSGSDSTVRLNWSKTWSTRSLVPSPWKSTCQERLFSLAPSELTLRTTSLDKLTLGPRPVVCRYLVPYS